MDVKELTPMTPLTQIPSFPKPLAQLPMRDSVSTQRISAKDLSTAALPSSQQKITSLPQAPDTQSSVKMSIQWTSMSRSYFFTFVILKVFSGFEEKKNGRPQVSLSSNLSHRNSVRTASTEMQTEIEEDKDIKRTLSSDHLLEARNGTSSNQGGHPLESDHTRVMSTCQSEDSVATCATRESRVVSVHSLKSVKSANGDICSQSSKGGYGYRFDFRSSCEFEFTDDVYI